MSNFIPHVFIGIGRDGHFFTLRQTYQRVVGRGKSVLSEHVQNLSQDPDEAMRMASEYASDRGMILKTTREELPDNLEEIFKRKREEVAAAKRRRQEEIQAERDRIIAYKKARREAQESKILDGIIPFGTHADKKMSDVPDYIKWMYGRREEFDPGSILEFMCEVIENKFASLLHSEYSDRYLSAEIGTRTEVRGVVKRVYTFQGDYGPVRYVTILEEDGTMVVTKGKWYTEEGKTVRILGTVKSKSVYQNQKQTVLNRVKELPRVS